MAIELIQNPLQVVVKQVEVRTTKVRAGQHQGEERTSLIFHFGSIIEGMPGEFVYVIFSGPGEADYERWMVCETTEIDGHIFITQNAIKEAIEAKKLDAKWLYYCTNTEDNTSMPEMLMCHAYLPISDGEEKWEVRDVEDNAVIRHIRGKEEKIIETHTLVVWFVAWNRFLNNFQGGWSATKSPEEELENIRCIRYAPAVNAASTGALGAIAQALANARAAADDENADDADDAEDNNA